VPAVVAERILVADDAPRFELVERAQQDRPILDAGALVELAAVAGGDAVLELAQADGVRELTEARSPAHDVEQGFEGRFRQLGGHVVEHPIRGSGGGPGRHERGIDGRGGRLYAHGVPHGGGERASADSAKNYTAGALSIGRDLLPLGLMACT